MNKKANNDSVKRVHSITTQTNSKFARILSNFDNKIDVHDYFLHERPFANVKIILNQQIIWCDKASLASASPIFREQLIRKPNDEPLVFNDINLNDFLSMLEFIYPIFNPEITEKNISCLIELSHRFQFDMLKNACQIYVIKYLNTIRRVSDNCHNSEAEGDCFTSNNNNGENERHPQRDLIEFHNRICVDASDIITKLCRWLKTYYNTDNTLPTQAIISVLEQISINYLEQAMTSVNINDEIKAYVYKERAQYLERIYHIKHNTL
ncbi:unnamed protein product [Adineta steineri]|uniref:BTB domain-containing protein n=1 Tax=Adineta steineri TaxID=433720 RepID=A0A818YST7_9BILA|nr:unnamed protein product [Adineta steineri]CAF3756995.1 unnamed protein product [Adineta steineri]